jgi:uncharacterized coiled-coil DUF342 family protein
MTEEDAAKAKAKKSEIENAERKFEELVAKRDEFNRAAIMARDERNSLNDRKRELLDMVQKMKIDRDDHVKLLREHKRLRTKFQDQARSILRQKRSKTGKIYSDLPSEAAARKAELTFLDMKQQTQVLTLEDEKELISDIHKKADELRRLEAELKDMEVIKVEVGEMDASISNLFTQADEQHQHVMKHYEEAQKVHERMMKLIEECSVLHNEADKKHTVFLESREKADAMHMKASEMRDKLLSMKNEKRMAERESRKIIQDQNRSARAALNDPTNLEKKLDANLAELLKKGKLTL